MDLTIELDQEDDGRWIAEVAAIPGVNGLWQQSRRSVEPS